MAEILHPDVRSWALAVDKEAMQLVPGEVIKLQRHLAFLVLGAAVEIGGRVRRLSGVVLMTPVDTGRARSSWQLSIGDSPAASVPPPGRSYRKNPPILGKAQTKLRTLGKYQTVWIASALPYIRVLEYGGYPDPVKRGTWDRKMKQWVIRSAGGFSKQAPRGMVRVTVAGVLAALR